MKRLPYLDSGRLGYLRIHLSREDWIDLAYLALAIGAVGVAWRLARS